MFSILDAHLALDAELDNLLIVALPRHSQLCRHPRHLFQDFRSQYAFNQAATFSTICSCMRFMHMESRVMPKMQ